MARQLILVIDDEADVLNLLSYNLKKEGFDVRLAEDGKKGIDLIRAQTPDAVILDLMLPEIDGFEVCRLIKQNPQTRNVPVLILSAKNAEVDQVVGLELGASDYLTKPFSVKVLIARLKKILKSSAADSSETTPLVFGDLSLDREGVHFSIKNSPIKLTKLEFSILSYFFGHAGSMVSRERLVREVWGDGSLVSAVSVNMHIASLRKKMGKHAHLLETVRGSGYRFSGEKSRDFTQK